MCRLLFVVVSLLVASSASAQTVVSSFLLPPEVLGDFPNDNGIAIATLVTAIPVEADGEWTTSEWLLNYAPETTDRWRLWQQWYRVVAMRSSGGYCLGPWFRPDRWDDGSIAIVRVNGRDRFVINWSWEMQGMNTVPIPTNPVYITGIREVTLDMPTCAK